MPIYICQTLQHNKFWKYTISGSTVIFQWGRVGGKSQEETKECLNTWSAESLAQSKARDKLKKGYKLQNEEALEKENNIAQKLGLQNKVQKLQWVSKKDKVLTTINNYDPNQYVYVEILNSWTKKLTRLLLSRTTSWELDGVAESDQEISFLDLDFVEGKELNFCYIVRGILKEISVSVQAIIKVGITKMGKRALFDDEEGPVEESNMPDFSSVTTCATQQVLGKFARMGTRMLDL